MDLQPLLLHLQIKSIWERSRVKLFQETQVLHLKARRIRVHQINLIGQSNHALIDVWQVRL